MARTHRKQQQQRNTVAIVGDGQTESIYFFDVRDTDRPKHLTIFPDIPGRIGNYKGVLGRAIALTDEYDHVFALIDFDKVLQDNQQEAYSRDKKQAIAAGVIVLENNPCFEIWLLLHFLHTDKLFNNCKEVEESLRHKDRIPGYNKSEGAIKRAGLYKNYKDLLMARAIPNAKRLERDREDRGPKYPRAEIYRFFEWYYANHQNT
ncbi:RloB family protein [Chitinophaga japonensis]|uniref:RloB-like protein n=1 Tax=Chitinophaga japonensis TaxID=104662 RepID=A0A562T6E4_CHIJA|nr:RloB family protein [Chitinophaga japonensis]TWI88824.1 RloB-like protein [Chitinophaga japonensis]